MNSGKNGHRITAIDITRDIIATIYIVDVATKDSRTCSKARRDTGRIILQLDQIIFHVFTIGIQRTYIGFSATAIYIIHRKRRVLGDLKQQSSWTRHTSLVTAAVEVSHLAAQQVPFRLNGHINLIIATEEITYLEGSAVRIGELVVEPHLLKAFLNEQVYSTVSDFSHLFPILHIDMVHHLTWIVKVDDGTNRHVGTVATAKHIDD